MTWCDSLISTHPAAEIEQVSGLFQEKQAELQSAVLRVEQLSLQLEDLRRGKLNGIQTGLGGQVTGAAALELRKLYQELQVLQEQVLVNAFKSGSTMLILNVITLRAASIVLINLHFCFIIHRSGIS